MRLRISQILLAGVLVCAPVMASAAGFDPAAATQAYLATLKGAARARSDAYFEGGYWLLLWNALAIITAHAVLLWTGLSARFLEWAAHVTKRRGLQAVLWCVPYVATTTLLTLAWDSYADFFRERQYGLMNLSYGGWLGEYAIEACLSLLAFVLFVPLLMTVVRRSPRGWWLWGAGGASLIVAFFALIGPVFISPLFNTYTEMPKGPLRDRIVAMAASQHVPADHIYVFDQSKQHDRVSANVSGLGPTIRISLNDNLLNRATPAEVASVMGHELGHYVLGHVWWLIGQFTLVFVALFWVASRVVPGLLSRYGQRWGVTEMDSAAAFPVYMIVLTVAFLVMTPITNSIIRNGESEADAFGLDVAREPDGFAGAALKLAQYRKLEPGPVEEILFYDHPSGATRIRMAMDWKARHLADRPAGAPLPAR